MKFPTNEEVEFFGQPEVRQFFGERWQLSLGDFFARPGEGYDVVGLELLVILTYDRTQVVWLPRPDQLLEMLEEKGWYRWEANTRPYRKQESWYREEWYKRQPSAKQLLTGADAQPSYENIAVTGPTPAIALGRCVMEIAEVGPRGKGR